MIVRAPRRKVSIPARMRAGGAPESVSVRDISARSMLIEATVSPPSGTFVEIMGPHSSIAGQVIWSRPDRFAVRTRERLNVNAAAAELRSLQLSAAELADAPCARPGRSGRATPDPAQQAERSRLAGRRAEFVAVAAGLTVAAGLMAAVAHHSLARPLAAIGKVLHGGR